MGWVFLIAIVFVAILYLAGLSNTDTQAEADVEDYSPTQKLSISDEAKQIAKNITTIKQFRSLERKLEKNEERMCDLISEKAYDKAMYKSEVLQAAVDIAQSKTYLWQFIPDPDLDTPIIILENAYKTYTLEEYNEIKNVVGSNDYEWHEIDGYGEKEDPEPIIKSLLKFREIVESKDSNEIIINKINQLVSRSTPLAEEFFDIEDSLSPGDQWFAEHLKKMGLPDAYELYSDGYTTQEKCLEINLSEFSKRKGIGPKKVALLEKFQEHIKNSTN